ncbi:MAG: DNA translocase FtsK 4TM domain-containing protein [Chitinispirillia bacterium]|jgi:S-DNA-T family DNA segregation ATPase FtsK/SpoIIIE
MAKSKKNKNIIKDNSKSSHEIWGIIYLTSGIFISVSLVSYLVNPDENVLGPYFGTFLSSGLIFLFGKIPGFLLPLITIYIGVSLFRSTKLDLRKLFFCFLLTLEICTLFSIHTITIIKQSDFAFFENCIGHIAVYFLHYVFGTHAFGPYFLFSVALVLTGSALFQINLRNTFLNIYLFFKKFFLILIHGISIIIKNIRMKMEKADQPDFAKQPVAVKKDTRITKTQKAIEWKQDTMPVQQDIDEEAKRLEQELADFRAKKDKPITISTIDQIDVGSSDNGSFDADDIDVEKANTVDPSIFNAEDSDEPFCKIPSLNEKREVHKPSKPYKIPSPDILQTVQEKTNTVDRQYFVENSHILEKTLLNFCIEGKVVHVSPGPVVTRYEIELAPGIKISKLVNLHDDLSMAVGGKKIRIEAPIPGKAAIGIELPNKEMQLVSFKNVLTSDVFRKSRAKLPIIIGKSISGTPFVTDVTKMPHLLIAGQTGSGKSVAINSFLCTLLMTKKPDELRLILIDPKKVEMSYYENIPHLMAPVVTESKEAVKALQWGVMEMTRRYRLLAKVHARNIDSFNQKVLEKSIKENVIPHFDNKTLPFIVIIVDELADLMLTASKDVEGLIQRVAQLARAVGIHLIVATQRPSVDIITGPIKANLTSRIAFRTIQSTDSRTILGSIGAEKLLGRGDMLFLRNGAPEVERFHGSFISEEDVENIVAEIKKQQFETEKIESFEDATNGVDVISTSSASASSSSASSDRDEKFEEAARLIVSTGLGSTSLLQRRLKLGYARAGRLMDELHEAGVVGPQKGGKVREVLVSSDVLEDMFNG